MGAVVIQDTAVVIQDTATVIQDTAAYQLDEKNRLDAARLRPAPAAVWSNRVRHGKRPVGTPRK